MAVIAYIVNTVADIYVFVIFAMVIMSWLINFNIINRHNQIVDMIWRTVIALTEPLLRPIRNVMPNLGGIDLSPLVLLILVKAVQYGLNYYIFAPALRAGL
ncbi:MAG: YggT family protein [Pseudomonadota bacterium]